MLRKRLFPLILSLLFIPTCCALAAETPPSTAPKLSLEDCLKLGLANSQDLQTAAQNVKIARESVRQAEIELGFSVDYSINHTRSDSANSNTGTISLDFPVFTRNKLGRSLKIARLELENVLEDERQTKLQVIYDIKKAFYDLWLKEQMLTVAQRSADNLKQHYDTIKKYVEVGKKAQYELLEAEVSWKEQKAEVTSALSNVSLAKLELATLIGSDKDQDLQITYDSFVQQIPEKVQLNLQTLLEKASQQRPDIRQAAQNIEIAQLNVAIAKGANLPNFSLSGSQNDLSDQFQLTVGIHGNLYDGGAKASKVRAAEQKVTIARLKDSKVRDAARQSMQKVFQSLQVDLENALAYRANIDLCKEDLRLTELSYQAGRKTIMDVKDRQLALDKAQNNYYQKVASYIIDLARLDLELGN